MRDGPIVFNLWKDTKVVCTASTIHTANATQRVKRKMKKQGGGYQQVIVPKPDAIYDYNRHMGGVDLSDQLLQYYQTRRQTHKFWKTLFYHSIDVAVTSAYILYRESLPESDRSTTTKISFLTLCISS